MKSIIPLIILIISMTLFCKKEEEEHFDVPDYKKWNHPVDRVLDTPIPGHGASFRIIYANDIAFKSKIIKTAGVPRVSMNDGSIIVKEVYDKREDIGVRTPGLFIMIKASKDPDAINGWTYYSKKPGQEAVEVKWRMCVGCHEAANEQHPYFDGNKKEIFRDYLFTLIAK